MELLVDLLAGGLFARFRGGVRQRGGPEVLCGGGPGTFGVQEELEGSGGEGGGG